MTDECSVCGTISTVGTLINTKTPKLRDHESDHLAAIEITAAIEEGIISNYSSEVQGLSIAFNNYIELEPAPVIRFFFTRPNRITGCIHHDQTLGATFHAKIIKIGN